MSVTLGSKTYQTDTISGEEVPVNKMSFGDSATLTRVTSTTPLPVVTSGYDAADDMVKVKSVQKKWRDSFTRPLTDLWDVTTALGTTATVSAGVLTVASGTTAAGYAELLSKETFTIPFRAMIGVQSGATRQANTHHYIEAVSVDSVTGVIDGRHSLALDMGGAASTTVTQAIYEVQNGGLAPLASAASTIVSTSTYSVLELEPFSDEAYFHSRTLDATTGRANSYVRHQQIPDPTAVYKLRIRSMNHQAWRSITGAVSGTAGVIRLTSTAHGYTGTPTVWVEALNGVLNGTAAVRGNYAITVVDANNIELTGTTFAGAYVTGSGRVALGAAPAAGINLQAQFINCQDYAELTAEITAGRGQAVEGQAIGARLVASTAAIGSVTVASGTVTTLTTLTGGNAAEDAATTSNPHIIGGVVRTAVSPTTLVAGDAARATMTSSGAAVVQIGAVPEITFSYAAAGSGIVNTTTAVQLRAAQAAGIRTYVKSMQVQTATLGAATELVLRDGAAGTVMFRTQLQTTALPLTEITFDPPLRGTAATLLEVATLTAVTGGVYVNVQGYSAA
jgi:hypothetical protein